MAQFDVVVVGLGAMGSAALHQLARRGVRVVGIERLAPGHDQGSSHGESRIIRLGYFEHPSYVPLLRRTYALWRELEAASGDEAPAHHRHRRDRPAGRRGGERARSRRRGCMACRTRSWTRPRPCGAFRRSKSRRIMSACSSPTAASSRSSPRSPRCSRRRRRPARRYGRAPRSCPSSQHGDGVRVETNQGDIDARTAIVAAGPWIKQLLPDLPAPLRVTRQVMGWFQPLDPAPFAGGRFPVFLLESRARRALRLSAVRARRGQGRQASPPRRDRRSGHVTTARFPLTDEALIRAALADHIPAANGPLAAAQTCLYTVTPDRDFLIDRLPGAPNIIVASPCSGHGFKFAPVVGEILADLATEAERATTFHVSRLRRFG